MRDKCDACKGSGHPATCRIQFKGQPYNPRMLEQLGADDEDDDAESSADKDAGNRRAYDF